MDQGDRISRWVLAVGLWGCSLWLVRYAFDSEEITWIYPAILLAFLGLIRVLTDLVELAAKPFTMMIDAIVYPKIMGGKPPPNYRLAEYYREQDRLEEAEAEYLTILKNHKREKLAYMGLIQLLIEQGEIEEARKWFQKARRHLRKQSDDLNDVEVLWSSLSNQFGPIP